MNHPRARLIPRQNRHFGGKSAILTALSDPPNRMQVMGRKYTLREQPIFKSFAPQPKGTAA